MSNVWACVVVVLLAGCSSKKEPDRSPIVREEEIPPPAQPVVPTPSDTAIDEQLMNGSIQPEPQALPDLQRECIDDSTLVSWDPAKLRACFDSNGDEQADRCVTWRRDGKVATIDTTFAVEDVDAKETPAPPVQFRSDQEHNDEERISNDGASIEVCGYERACLKFKPKTTDGEIQTVLTDPDYKRAVVVIKDYESQKGVLEMWDLEAGKLRTRAEMKRLVEDETYEFSAHLGAGVVIALADDSNSRALGTIYGLDGSFRGELARGSRNLATDKTFHHAGVFGIVDVGAWEADDKPYVLYLHSLSSGAAIGKFSIKRDDDGDDDLSFHTLPNGFVGVAQFGEQVRIDMIDLRTKTNRVLFAPGC